MTEPHRGFVRWLVPASALHLAVLWFVSTQRAPQWAPLVIENPVRELEVEFDAAQPRAQPSGIASIAAAPMPSVAARAAAGSGRHGARAPTVVAPGAAVAALESPNVVESVPRAPLSLDALGVGRDNPFLARSAETPAPAPRARGTSRFQRALAGDLARADQAVALGPEGPVLSSLELATRAGNPEPNSTAVFDCLTDASGHVTSVELVQASSALAPWREIAQRTLEGLRSQRLRLPRTGVGVSFRIRVSSHVELPSGADPGLTVTLAGIPLKKGRGPRSSRIDILDVAPKLTTHTTTLPSGQTVETPALQIGSILSVHADPADIGAPEQRMVRAHLERLTINDAPPNKQH